jgi:hypothetical protein
VRLLGNISLLNVQTRAMSMSKIADTVYLQRASFSTCCARSHQKSCNIHNHPPDVLYLVGNSRTSLTKVCERRLHYRRAQTSPLQKSADVSIPEIHPECVVSQRIPSWFLNVLYILMMTYLLTQTVLIAASISLHKSIVIKIRLSNTLRLQCVFSYSFPLASRYVDKVR